MSMKQEMIEKTHNVYAFIMLDVNTMTLGSALALF